MSFTLVILLVHSGIFQRLQCGIATERSRNSCEEGAFAVKTLKRLTKCKTKKSCSYSVFAFENMPIFYKGIIYVNIVDILLFLINKNKYL